VRSSGELRDILARKPPRHVNGLVTLHDVSLVYDHRALIAEYALKRQLPSSFQLKEYVEAGGLMSYGMNFPDLWRRMATYVDKVLKGAKPADLPIEQPTKFELVINVRTAKALGLTIPRSVLVRADQILE
jgi:putative tryptophan/tyrosine transport system substrate-binding protein